MSKETVVSVSKDVAEDLSTLRTDVAKLLALLVDLAKVQAGAMRSNAVEAAETTRDRFGSARDALSQRASVVSERVRGSGGDLGTLIEQNPAAAVLLAALGGFIVGRLSRSRF